MSDKPEMDSTTALMAQMTTNPRVGTGQTGSVRAVTPQTQTGRVSATPARTVPITATSSASAPGSFSHHGTGERRTRTSSGPSSASFAALASQNSASRPSPPPQTFERPPAPATPRPSQQASSSPSTNRPIFGSPTRNAHLGSMANARLSSHAHMLAMSQQSQKPFLHPSPEGDATIDEMVNVNYVWKITRLKKLVQELKEASKGAEQRGGFVEDEALEHEALTTCQAFGDGVWKIELVPTRDVSRNVNRNPTKIISGLSSAPLGKPIFGKEKTKGKTEHTMDELSIYLTYIPLVAAGHQARPYPPTEAHVMLAVREPVQVGERGSMDTGWLWRRWESGIRLGTVQAEEEDISSDFWECHELPGLEAILRGSARVRAADEVHLVVQVHWSPLNPFPSKTAGNLTGPFALSSQDSTPHLQYPHKGSAPRNLLQATASLLDDPETSDVCIIIVSSATFAHSTGHSQAGTEDGDCLSLDELVLRGLPSESSIVPEDRVIYAHSAILRSRSEYFERMLGGGFSEGRQGSNQMRAGGSGSHDLCNFYGKKHVVRLEDVEYGTVWAMLKWMYTDEITFGEDNLKDVGADEMVSRSSTTVSSVVAALAKEQAAASTNTTSRAKKAPTARTAGMGPAPAGRLTTSQVTRHQAATTRPATAPAHGARTNARSASPSVMSTISATSSTGTRRSSNKTSPRMTRDTPDLSARAWRSGFRDPMEHPNKSITVDLPSAIAVYTLAHRYNLRELSALAIEHISGTLTPDTVFPLILASSVWTELYNTAKTYAFANWSNVVASPSYTRCIHQIGEGLWEHGARILGDLLTETGPRA